MQVIALSTCDCGNEKCAHSQSVIVCLCADDKEEREHIDIIVEQYEGTPLELPEQLIKPFWKEIETQADIFKVGKRLLNIT